MSVKFLEDGKMVKAKDRKPKRGFQFVWWGWSEFRAARWGDVIQWHRYYDPSLTSWAYIYSWRLVILPFEIRRWAAPYEIVKARAKYFGNGGFK